MNCQPKSIDQIRMLVYMMLWADSTDSPGEYAWSTKPDGTLGVFGCCRKAICEIVNEECGIDISDCDWNEGGNQSYLQDVLVCIHREYNRLFEIV